MDALAGFPALTDVRLTGNPVIPQAESDARYEVCAREEIQQLRDALTATVKA